MNKTSSAPSPQTGSNSRGFLIAFACIVGLLLYFFHDSFVPNLIIFSNDGPLGAISNNSASMPEGFHGVWQDLSWIGGEGISAAPSFTILTDLIVKPLGYAKFMGPIALLMMSLSAWFMFRRMGMAPMACIIAALAALLNSDYFSITCWGVVAQAVTFGANFLAVGAMADHNARRPWVRTILAGLAVGLGIMEGFDIGAIFSVVTAAYVVFNFWNTAEARPAAAKLLGGVVRVAIIACFAAYISVSTLNVLINTQIKGIVGTAQDEATREAQWTGATIWSLPKAETLQIIVPGLFGYRMDSPAGANYWGTIGKNPQADVAQKYLNSSNPNERAQAEQILANPSVWRFSGGGIYTGVMVVLVAIYAAIQSFRKKGSPFTVQQRRAIWFWMVVGLISLGLAYGKYAPFYRIFYSLPYASTIRNPAKFVHVVAWANLVLFAYGLHAIYRSYMQNSVIRVPGVWAQFKAWRSKATPFERNWVMGTLWAVIVALLGLLVYASSNEQLISYLKTVGIQGANARQVASFSLAAVGWFLFFLALSVATLALVFSGQFTGARAKWGAILIGLITVVDLGRADAPWVIYWDYTYKYATNPILDFLRHRPYDHRATMFHFQLPDEAFGNFQSIYGLEWTQHLFLYYNIQTIDLIQESRETIENDAYRKAIPAGNPATLLRLWQLTNTRYVLGPSPTVLQALLQKLDPGKDRFKIVERFDIVPKGDKMTGNPVDFTVNTNANGALTLLEFTDALPRAKLYSNWEVNTNMEAALSKLPSPSFDPAQTVIVGTPTAAPLPANTNQPAGTVTIRDNYHPKRVELDADVTTPSILLLNDKYSPKWHVYVDGAEAPLLRCNYIMRGVALAPGKHDVVFQFKVSDTPFYITCSAIGLAVVLVGFLVVSKPGGTPQPVKPVETAQVPAPGAKTEPKPSKKK